MTNLLQQAINCDDADHAAKLIRDALGIESDDEERPDDRERGASYIGVG
jgi:hypothetical protein